jgi:hypothetical protein
MRWLSMARSTSTLPTSVMPSTSTTIFSLLVLIGMLSMCLSLTTLRSVQRSLVFDPSCAGCQLISCYRFVVRQPRLSPSRTARSRSLQLARMPRQVACMSRASCAPFWRPKATCLPSSARLRLPSFRFGLSSNSRMPSWPSLWFIDSIRHPSG